MLVEVAVAAPLDSSLTYELPESLFTDRQISAPICGIRLLVPLGKRRVTGYILGLSSEKEVSFTVKKVVAILDDAPVFPENCVEFFRWIARYYHYPLGEVLQTALPSGMNTRVEKVLRLVAAGTVLAWPLSPVEEPEWFAELLAAGELSAVVTKYLLKDPEQKRLIRRLCEKKVVLLSYSLRRDDVKKKEEICYSCSVSIKPLEIKEPDRKNLADFLGLLEEGFGRNFKFSEGKLLNYFFLLAGEKGKPVPRKELLERYPSGSAAINGLVDAGVLKKSRRRVYRNPLGMLPEVSDGNRELSEEQKPIVQALQKSIASERYSPHLLFGVTGGGKTEVYLQAAAFSLEQGRDVLVLVPEIALAAQLEAQFIDRFPDTVALLHSGLSKGERFDQWALAAEGRARIVIGARSAVFAPLQNIGLIIVDEEHDGGYKQDDGLRYNGRDLAVLRAQLQKCTVLLGSATPSIGSYYNAVAGKYALHRITRRIGDSLLPEVTVVDLNATRRSADERGILSGAFVKQLERTLAKKEQSVVLLNRRGFSSSYLCQECGASVQCPNCNISLTYHKQKGELRCHYCGYTTTSRLVCANCCSDKLVPFGVGTERVEEEIRERFPDAVIQRLDSDIAAKRAEFFAILQRMRQGEIDILIGTQMVAKGHHFPGVTFVGVVWADGGLNMPDFRAAERTYQLLSQVTGRAGRGEKPGRVIIQTMSPHHYAVDLARRHCYEKFYERELAVRRNPAFPPFVRLAQIRISGEVEYDVRKTASDIAHYLRGLSRQQRDGTEKRTPCDVLGPASAPIEKIKNSYRWQVMLKGYELALLHATLGMLEEQRKKITTGTAFFTVDVDPENMM